MGGHRISPHRLAQAQQHYHRCNLCEHRCLADRLAGQLGPCKAGSVPRLFRHRVEYGEELDLIPSHLLYLSGCDLRCVFCIAGLDAFDPTRGQDLTKELFNQAVAWGIQQGARNVQWVGGEPTIHLPALLEIMAQCPDLPPVVWKSDFHFTSDALALLDGVVDVYVADFKWGNQQCASRLGGGDGYMETVGRNLIAAASQTSRLIVRHLLLPGHLDCCMRPIARWLQENVPNAEFSLRLGYLPSWRSGQFTELTSPLSRVESAAARRLAAESGLVVIQ
jgi:putative pyruvate formate lyase activating enzyme